MQNREEEIDNQNSSMYSIDKNIDIVSNIFNEHLDVDLEEKQKQQEFELNKQKGWEDEEAGLKQGNDLQEVEIELESQGTQEHNSTNKQTIHQQIISHDVAHNNNNNHHQQIISNTTHNQQIIISNNRFNDIGGQNQIQDIELESFEKRNEQKQEQVIQLGTLTQLGSDVLQSEQNLQQDKQSTGVSQQKSTVAQASVNLFKSYIGAGILGLPLAFSQAGYILASVCMMGICGMMLYTSTLIFDIQDAFRRPNMGFKDIFEQTMGRRACNWYQVFLVFAQVGCCVSYVIFFTEFFQIAFGTIDDPSSRIYYLLFSLVFILPLTMINNFHFFVKWSKVANVLTILVLLGIIEFALETILTKPSYKNEHNLAHLLNLAGFLGIAIYSFEAIGTMFYVKESMQEPHKFPQIFTIVSIAVASICVLFSTICSLAWGDRLKSIVLLGLEKQRSYFLLLSALYAVNMIFSYPVQFYPIMDALNKLNVKYSIPNKYKYVPRFATTFLIFLFAFIIPKFGIMLNLVGAIAGVALQFFFPIFAYQTYFRKSVSRSKSVINYSILTIAIISGLFSIQHSLRELAG